MDSRDPRVHSRLPSAPKCGVATTCQSRQASSCFIKCCGFTLSGGQPNGNRLNCIMNVRSLYSMLLEVPSPLAGGFQPLLQPAHRLDRLRLNTPAENQAV